MQQSNETTKECDNLKSKYLQMVEAGLIKKDGKQIDIVAHLDSLAAKIVKQSSLKSVLFSRKSKPKGIYIYGDVGRGKSMLMDLFFENISYVKKRRIHFHAFMREIHEKLFEVRESKQKVKNDDYINFICKEFAKQTKLLCLDEMEINDITDAMIIGRLFESLFKYDVVIVTTSNRHPDELYKDGLMRDNFLPFIELIKHRLSILSLDAKQDYRMLHLKTMKTIYITPNSKDSIKELESIFKELSQNSKPVAATVKVGSRKLVFNKTHGDNLFVSFDEICRKALGASDFIEIAKEFNTIIMADIPVMTKEDRNEARRFINFIDELYEHNVNFICSAAAEPEELYKEGTGSFEFKRTISRLYEMRTEQYLESPHIS